MADLIAPLPLIRLYGGMVIKLEAIDPTTGATVAGVTVADVTIYGRELDGGDDAGGTWPLFLTPQDV